MSPARIVLVLAAFGLPASGAAQALPDTSAPANQAQLVAVPADLAAVEEARTRACVPVFAALAQLDADLDPLARRAQRIQELARAMALEDSAEVAPFKADDPLEQTVRQWFASDAELARRYAETRDSTLLVRRQAEKDSVRQELRDTLASVGERGQSRVSEAGDLQAATALCQGKIMVRPVVVEVCDTVSSPVCEPAVNRDPESGFRFVEDAVDLWDVEQLNPWSEPSALGSGPDGALVGGRTAGSVRRGNVRIMVGVGYILERRSELDPEQVAQFQANLDTMGFAFEHPDLVMAPALDILLDVPAPLDGETHYFLHFGDLSDPASQVVWTVSAARGGPIRASIPAAPGALARLQAGEALSVTAVEVAPEQSAEDTTEAEARYTIPLTPVAQAPAVSRLLSYMASGGFSDDLARIVPPSAGGG